MSNEKAIQMITDRIMSEHRKHKDIDWERIAAHKIYASLNKLYNLHDVMQQSELLQGFLEWYEQLSIEEHQWYQGRYVETYLKDL